MQTQDKKRFASAFGVLCTVFDRESSSLLVKAYFAILKSHKIETVENAITRAMATCKYFPKPVELIEFISGGSQGLEDYALVEAGNVIAAVKQVGAHASVKFEDQTTAAVIQQGFGGWVQLCSGMTGDQEKWFIRDFARMYQSYSRQNIELSGALPGTTEILNSAEGRFEHIPEPVLIGSKKGTVKAIGNMMGKGA